MKKTILSIVAIASLLALPLQTLAYTIQPGDTPYQVFGPNWAEQMEIQIGHSDPYSLPVGVEVDTGQEEFGDSHDLGGRTANNFWEDDGTNIYPRNDRVVSTTEINLDTINTTEIKIPAEDIERIVDGDFESAAWNDYYSPDSWTVGSMGGDMDVDLFARTTDSHAGTYALDIKTSVSGATDVFIPSVNSAIGVDDTVALRFYAKETGGTDKIAAGILYENAAEDSFIWNFTGASAGTWTAFVGSFTSDNSYNPTLTTSYAQYTSGTATLPSSDVAGVNIIFVGTGGNSKSAYLDSVEILVNGTDDIVAGDFDDWTATPNPTTPLNNWTYEVQSNDNEDYGLRRTTSTHAGTYAVELKQEGGKSGDEDLSYIYQKYTGTVGATINASIWAKSSSSTKPGQWIFLDNSEGHAQAWNVSTSAWANMASTTGEICYTGTVTTEDYRTSIGSTTTAYMETTESLTIPASGKIVMIMCAGGSSEDIDTYFDDASMIETDGTPSNSIDVFKVENTSTLSELESKDSIIDIEVGGETAFKVDGEGEIYTTNDRKLMIAPFEQNTVSMSGDTVTPDADTYNFFDIYLNRDVTRINMPTGGVEGMPIRFQIRQDGTGGREVVWGSADENTGLTANLTKGVDPAVTITITTGTMDWSTLSSAAGRKSHLCFGGWNQNPMNLNDIQITSFDESAGTITFNHPFYDSITDVTGDTAVGIEVKNSFYFVDEKGDSWIGQHSRAVTLFEYFDSGADGSGILNKMGVYSNAVHTKAKVRFEEQLTDDFVNGSDEGLLNWREANENGTTVVASDDVNENNQGLLRQRLSAGVADDGRTSTSLGVDQFSLGNMRVGIEGIIKPNANAFGTADVKFYFGWSESQRFYNTDDGAYFEIVADGSGAGRVWVVLEDSTVRTTYDTGIDLVEDEFYSLHIGIPATNEDIHFTVNDVTVYEGLMSNVGTNEKLTCGFAQYYEYVDTTLPNNKDWFIDAFSLKYRMNADRI